MWDVIHSDPDIEEMIEKMFPKRWLVRLYYSLSNGETNLTPFSKTYGTESEIEQALSEGIVVADAENPVVKQAIAALVKHAAIAVME